MGLCYITSRKAATVKIPAYCKASIGPASLEVTNDSFEYEARIRLNATTSSIRVLSRRGERRLSMTTDVLRFLPRPAAVGRRRPFSNKIIASESL